MDERIRLYGIGGAFQVDEQGNFGFGGYFKYDDLTMHIFDGQLADYFGASKIDGFMKGDYLKFQKDYPGYRINYEFTKGENGLWLGEWVWKKQDKRTRKGRAVCVVNELSECAGDLIGTNRQGIPVTGMPTFMEFVRSLAERASKV